jgi:hypothetical protein
MSDEMGKMIMNSEEVRTWKLAVVVYSEILSWHLIGEALEYHLHTKDGDC